MKQIARLAVTGSFLVSGAFGGNAAGGQTAGTTSAARASESSPTVSYTLRVDGRDTTRLFVEMRVTNAPTAFRVAMAAHPEYNERFFRYVRDLRTTAGSSVTREDSALWRVTARNGSAALSYSIELPAREPALRGSWRMFLTPRGGLVGGYDTFMYLPDLAVRDLRVAIVAPPGWDVATALARSGERSFTAPDQLTLVESPILLGRLRLWQFRAGGARHNVFYWNAANATPFDSAAFVAGVRGFAERAIDLFGGAPYREFSFLFQDAAYGGLEHMNSVTLGAPSDRLAENPHSALGETAHEFFHSWNLMRIRPTERGGLDYRPNGQTSGLWFSEGLTLYYADVLVRRAGFPTDDSTRVAHVEGLLERYLFNAGNTRVSPERASLAEYTGGAASLGGYDPSVHLQGELLGTALDLIIRNATGGRRSADDLMRLMMARHSAPRGFTAADIEQRVGEICDCNVSAFFADHVRKGVPLDFNNFLATIGMRVSTEWKPAVDDSGKVMLDYRLRIRQTEGRPLQLYIIDPESIWARAGLRTGDELVSLKGKTMATPADFRTAFRTISIGDTVEVVLKRNGITTTVPVIAAGYDRPIVRILSVPSPTRAQLAIRAAWVAAK